MPLESLLAVVEKLRGRIETHGNSLTGSEWLTRYALIDPLLRELGWDTEDPDMVIPEFSVNLYGGGTARADYALINMSTGNPLIMVEAKRLDESLQRRAVSQGITDCLHTGTIFFAVTDGRKWEIYDTRKRVTPPEMKVVDFDLSNDSPADVCLKALALWRYGAMAENVTHAQTLVAGLMGAISADTAQSTDATMNVANPTPVAAQPTPTISAPQQTIPGDSRSNPEQVPAAAIPSSPSPVAQQSPSATPAPNGEWRPLSEAIGMDKTIKLQGIMFPDGSSVTTRNWDELTVEVVRWLNDNDRLPQPPFRIQSSTSKTRYVVAEQPISPSGEHYDGMTEVADGVWVINHLHHDTAAGNARVAIRHVDMDPAAFQVLY